MPRSLNHSWWIARSSFIEHKVITFLHNVDPNLHRAFGNGYWYCLDLWWEIPMVGFSLEDELIIQEGASNLEQLSSTEDSANGNVASRCKSRMHHVKCVSSLTWSCCHSLTLRRHYHRAWTAWFALLLGNSFSKISCTQSYFDAKG